MTKPFFLFLCFLKCGQLYAQQDPRFTLFNFNYTTLNPASTGSRDKLVSSLIHRYQWSGYSQAPNTTAITVELPFFPLRSAFAVNFINDNVGILKKNLFSVNYACIANISKYKRLAFGAQFAINHTSVNFSSLNTDPDNDNLNIDQALNNGNNISSTDFQLGLGVYYYTQKWKIGLSVPSVNSYNYYGVESLSPKVPHLFFMSGYNLVINDRFFYNPRVLIKYTNGSPIQLDFFNQLVFQRKFGPGFSIRTAESISFLFSYLPHQNFIINYSYDLVSLNKIRTYQYGSHEISLVYQLPLKFNDIHKKRTKESRKRKCIDFEETNNREKKEMHDQILRIYYSLD